MQAPPATLRADEYLRTSFADGDHEYVNGRIVERNLGENDHSKTQKKLIVFFDRLERTDALFAFPDQRIRISANRFRVPDLCVYLGSEPEEQVFQTPPFLARRRSHLVVERRAGASSCGGHAG